MLQEQTRSELLIDTADKDANKVLYDALYADKDAIEDACGLSLDWQRLPEKKASRISFTVPGGWADDGTWPGAIEAAVDAMKRLYSALAPRVDAARGGAS